MAFHNVKACPFCGGRPYIESHSRGYLKGESQKVVYVRCTECGARSDKMAIHADGLSNGEVIKAAVRKWNARYDAVGYVMIGDHRR